MAGLPPPKKPSNEEDVKSGSHVPADAMVHLEYLKAVAQQCSQQGQPQQPNGYPFGSLNAYSELLLQQYQRQHQAAQRKSMENVLRKLSTARFSPDVKPDDDISEKDQTATNQEGLEPGLPGQEHVTSLLANFGKSQTLHDNLDKDSKLKEILSHIYHYVSKHGTENKVRMKANS